MLKNINSLFVTLILLSLTACLGMPDSVKPVQGFDKQRYLGKWYEIARLDNRFEKGLEQVTAEYSLRNDGAIRVLNRGYSADKSEWKEADGKAIFVNDETEGYLKVSFFGPFYSSYVVFELDTEYQYSFISGADYSYLWLLSRTPEVNPELLETFKQKASKLGFKLDELVIVNQQ